MDCWTLPLQVDEEFEKLILRVNPPRVTVDNRSSPKATVIKVDSANRRGSLLEVVQVITDMNLIIRRAYISSDGEWFMDVFHVTDKKGNKLSEDDVADRIQQSLGPRARSFRSRSMRRSGGAGTQQDITEQTTIELSGRDRPGLLCNIFQVLTSNGCNVEAAEVWTHNSRMASVVYITDQSTGCPIDDSDRMDRIERRLLSILMEDMDRSSSANTAVTVGKTHMERRLHQMMHKDQDFDDDDGDDSDKTEEGCRSVMSSSSSSLPSLSSSNSSDWGKLKKPVVTVENCMDRGYTVVSLRCLDRPKLIFDTVCTLTDMHYVVYHGTILAEGPEAYQEYYIRNKEGRPIRYEAERQRLINCLEAAIKRRTSEGIRLELCGEDRIGLLADVTCIFTEHGLSVTQAEVTTRGSQALNTFYVIDSSGNPVKSEKVEALREEIGSAILLQVVEEGEKDENPKTACSRVEESGVGSSLGSLFWSQSEKFLYSLGLIRSYS